MDTRIRMLGPDDAAAYRAVRRRALIEHPEAYGATLDELDRRSLEEIANTLASPPELRCLFGAFVGDELAGLAGFGRSDNAKLRHRSGLYQMYTAPEQRRRSLGRQLSSRRSKPPSITRSWRSRCSSCGGARRLPAQHERTLWRAGVRLL
jgi:GNAT superfamily N-acetyltransferase